MHLISAFSALFTALMVFATPSWAQIQRSESSLPQPADLLADKTLADWRDVWDRAHRSTKAEHFEVQDGVLRIKGGTNGAIVTSKKYETFELRFQWRWPDAPGNGGVMFHTEPSRGALFVTGIEVQLRDGEAGDIYGVGINALSRDRKRQQGNRIMRMPLNESQTPIEKPAGQWNEAVVYCHGDSARIRINGRLVNEALRIGRTSGRIAIQAEDADIELRDVTITPITTAKIDPDQPAIKLYNGNDFTGWTADIKEAKDGTTYQLADVWSIRDGLIHCLGKPAGVIQTDETYSNYKLTVEWRWPETPGNSGTLIHCSTPRERNIWPKSLESQLASGHAGDFWTIGEEVTIEDTDPSSRIPPKKGFDRNRKNLTDDSENPAGQWNRVEIYAVADTVRVFVNGDLVNEGWDITTDHGAICLQSEGAPIQFRRVELQPLLAEASK